MASTQPSERFRAALQVVGSVVAPTTLLTALLFYFGRAHARYFFNYFGIDVSLLGLTTQDYLIRSVDALLVPLVVGLGVGLVLLWVYARVSGQLFDRPEAATHLRWAAMATGILGLVLFLTGMDRIVVAPLEPAYTPLLPLSVGAVNLSVGLVLLRLNVRHSGAFFHRSQAMVYLRWTAMATVILGTLLLAIGTARKIGTAVDQYSLIFPLSLSAGTFLLLYASRLYRRFQLSAGVTESLDAVALFEATGAILLAGLGLFWAANNYAAAVGESRAHQVEDALTSEFPRVILDSRDRLHLGAAGVEETRCAASDSGFRFRYQGLRLMLRSGGQYFFLPDTWSRSDGAALMIPEGDALRLQFSWGPSTDATSC